MQPLPPVPVVKTTLPHGLFGDAVMVVEFLRAFGPLFNLKEVISTDVSFGKKYFTYSFVPA